MKTYALAAALAVTTFGSSLTFAHILTQDTPATKTKTTAAASTKTTTMTKKSAPKTTTTTHTTHTKKSKTE